MIQERRAVRLEVQTGFAILTIDNPPVNAGSTAVRAGLLAGLGKAAQMDIEGIVILGAGRSFIAGSDIREFGAPLAKPELPEVIAAIEDSPHPVCAAIHGASLGGGFELALGCDLRVAAPDAVMGLPEVTLGMVPGAGGTQRLPRLTGIAQAIALVCSAGQGTRGVEPWNDRRAGVRRCCAGFDCDGDCSHPGCAMQAALA
jgi:3-hydroxyacyl-CoA dehydrogenase